MKVIVTTTGCVDYKKKLYFKDDEIELPDKTAQHLLDKGVCETPSRSPFLPAVPLADPPPLDETTEERKSPGIARDGGQADPPPLDETTEERKSQGIARDPSASAEALRCRAGGGQDDTIARTPALKRMTVAKLKKLLDKLEVSYKARTKKADLIALVEANTSD